VVSRVVVVVLVVVGSAQEEMSRAKTASAGTRMISFFMGLFGWFQGQFGTRLFVSCMRPEVFRAQDIGNLPVSPAQRLHGRRLAYPPERFFIGPQDTPYPPACSLLETMQRFQISKITGERRAYWH
jgi:hypothetical protein